MPVYRVPYYNNERDMCIIFANRGELVLAEALEGEVHTILGVRKTGVRDLVPISREEFKQVLELYPPANDSAAIFLEVFHARWKTRSTH